MAQNLKDLFKDQAENDTLKMSQGHEARFLEKLDKSLPEKKAPNYFSVMNIAASLVLLLGLSYAIYNIPSDPVTRGGTEIVSKPETLKTLGDFSPDLKKVEDYYLASINLELSKVQLTPDNKELFDGYIQRLKELNDEYENLIKELNDNGPNGATLDAIIANLKFRLNLVIDLKGKLKEFSGDALLEENI